jgi:DNA polymerase-3 subunit epsilon
MNDIIRPLVIPDIETTGLDKEKDFIIQFAAIKVNRQTGVIIDSLNLYIKPTGPYTITIQAYLKHKIKPADLEDKPTFAEVADKIRNFFEGCDILTYNGNSFDLPFIKCEFKRIGQDIDFLTFDCYDAFLEEKRRNGINLENTYKRYTGKTMEEDGLTAHDAFSDVKATYKVFEEQQKIQEYGPEKRLTEDNVIILGNFDNKEQPVFAIGKYKELPVSYVANIDQQYLSWCVSQNANFMESTKNYIRQYIK